MGDCYIGQGGPLLLVLNMPCLYILSLSGFTKEKMHVIIFMTGYSEPPYFVFLRGRSRRAHHCLSVVLPRLCNGYKDCFYFFCHYNYEYCDYCQSVSSSRHCGEGLKIPPQLPFKRLKSCLRSQSPFELKGIKR